MDKGIKIPWGLIAIGEMAVWIVFGLLLIPTPGAKTAAMLSFGAAILFGLLGLIVLKGESV